VTLVHRAIRGRVVEERVDQSQLAWEGMRARRMDGWAHVPVTPDIALEVPAVSACVHGIAGAISTLQIHGYRQDAQGMPAPTASLPRLWREPSAELSPEDWIYRHLQAQMLDGMAWGRIVARDARLSPTQVELVPAEVVTVRTDKSTGLMEFRFDGQMIDREDVWRVGDLPSRTGIFGAALVDRMRTSLQVQLAARKYLLQWFTDGAHPTAILTTDANPGEQGAEKLKARLLSIMRGNRDPLVLPAGTSLTQFQNNPDQSKVIDVLKQSANDLATFFLTPPELAGGETGSSMTYSTTEQQQIMVLQRAVRYWMVKLERALTRPVAPTSLYAKFDEEPTVHSTSQFG
jgi:HK97 family phage portal protein